MSGLDFLALVLQSSYSLNLNAFFKFASIYFFLLTWSMFSFCLWGLVFLLFFLHARTGILNSFGLKSSNGYEMKPMFSEGLSIFVFVFNDGALNLLRHVVELSLSVTMWRAAETKQKLSMSRLDFLVLVLQSSNSFDLIFFQVLLSRILAGYKLHFHLLH